MRDIKDSFKQQRDSSENICQKPKHLRICQTPQVLFIPDLSPTKQTICETKTMP